MSLAFATLSAAVITLVGTKGLSWVRSFRTARPEATRILIDSASELVVIQKGFIEDLQAEMSAMKVELAQIRVERDSLAARVKLLEDELHIERSKKGLA